MTVPASGLTVPVQLWVPRAMHSPVAPIDTLAEINTAYPLTVIQEGVATSLGLEPVVTATLSTTTRLLYEASQFIIRLIFPAEQLAFELLVAEVPYLFRPKGMERIKCVIGRDVLRYGVLTYNGPADTVSLEFTGALDEQRHTANTGG